MNQSKFKNVHVITLHYNQTAGRATFLSPATWARNGELDLSDGSVNWSIHQHCVWIWRHSQIIKDREPFDQRHRSIRKITDMKSTWSHKNGTPAHMTRSSLYPRCYKSGKTGATVFQPNLAPNCIRSLGGWSAELASVGTRSIYSWTLRSEAVPIHLQARTNLLELSVLSLELPVQAQNPRATTTRIPCEPLYQGSCHRWRSRNQAPYRLGELDRARRTFANQPATATVSVTAPALCWAWRGTTSNTNVPKKIAETPSRSCQQSCDAPNMSLPRSFPAWPGGKTWHSRL